MAELDLDAARAARAEKSTGHNLKLGGESFALPAELPLSFGLRLLQGDTLGALQVVLGDRWEAFLNLDPSGQDVEAFLEGVPKLYGTSAGEAEASQPSSNDTGKPARRRSKPPTTSTSAKSGTAV